MGLVAESCPIKLTILICSLTVTCLYSLITLVGSPLKEHTLFSSPKPTKRPPGQEWQRVGFGSGFSISEPDPRVKPRSPDPVRLLNRFFSRGPDPSPPGPAGSTGPVGPWYFMAHSVAQSKKKKNVCNFKIFFKSPSYFSIYSVTFSRTKILIFSIVSSFYSFSLFLLLLEEDEEAF